jgi:hypothetical protein
MTNKQTMPHTFTSEKIEQRLQKHFPGYFEGAFYEKEDTNLGDELVDFILSELEAYKAELRKEIEGMKYIFERPKEDYLPEVYKHLKSKNEALDSVLSSPLLEEAK